MVSADELIPKSRPDDLRLSHIIEQLARILPAGAIADGETYIHGVPLWMWSLKRLSRPRPSRLIETQGGSDSVTCSAQLTTTGQVSGFAIFKIQSSGQEAVVPLETRTSGTFVLAYDNTSGLATGLALANVSATAATVPVTVFDDTGATLTRGAIPLAANGHTLFMPTDNTTGFPVAAGKRGTVEFQTPSGGQISSLGIRAVGSVTTTIPVLAK